MSVGAYSKYITNIAERWLCHYLNFCENEAKYKIYQNDTRAKQAYFP